MVFLTILVVSLEESEGLLGVGRGLGGAGFFGSLLRGLGPGLDLDFLLPEGGGV